MWLLTCEAEADERVSTPSGGMRRLLLIARGLVHDPQLVLLDEPTVGLDPQVRQQLRSTIAAIQDDGVTVLMSTATIAIGVIAEELVRVVQRQDVQVRAPRVALDVDPGRRVGVAELARERRERVVQSGVHQAEPDLVPAAGATPSRIARRPSGRSTRWNSRSTPCTRWRLWPG